MILAVASGKGGTGKTTVSANLARALEEKTQLLDCDVEEPNAHLFLHGKKLDSTTINIAVPKVDASICTGCNACGTFCEYSAIISFGKAPILFPEMCHGCGGCMKVCPQHAITESEKRIGTVETFQSENITLVHGRIDVGVAMAPPLINAVKKCIGSDMPAILDAPPGTSCPVITTLRKVDYVLLVTEPTPFGLHDLSLAVDMVRELSIPFSVIVNRVGIGDERVHTFCQQEDIPIIMEIPDDRRIAEAYSRGELMVDALPEYKKLFQDLFEKIKKEIQVNAPALN
ncbi:MAG: ATP-binding protein [Candidatus Hydrogenedentes bacterium]|nr:ATP-binding protein [Candidatus Hydrogenedentota bacterium]